MINTIFEWIFHGSAYILGFIFLLAMLHFPLFGPLCAGLLLDKWGIVDFTGEAFWGFCIVVWAYQIWYSYQLAKRVD